MKRLDKSSRAQTDGSGRGLALASLACALLAAGCSRPADSPPTAGEARPEERAPAVPMPGGWFTAEADDLSRQVFAEAVRQQGAELALIAIDSLEQQVVAGMNYRGELRVRQGTAERRARVAIFRGLDGQVTLRDWQWLSVP